MSRLFNQNTLATVLAVGALIGVPGSLMGNAALKGLALDTEFPQLASQLDTNGMEHGGRVLRDDIAHCMAVGFRSYRSQKIFCRERVLDAASARGGPAQRQRIETALNSIHFTTT